LLAEGDTIWHDIDLRSESRVNFLHSWESSSNLAEEGEEEESEDRVFYEAYEAAQKLGGILGEMERLLKPSKKKEEEGEECYELASGKKEK
jgi:hypothetical protein